MKFGMICRHKKKYLANLILVHVGADVSEDASVPVGLDVSVLSAATLRAGTYRTRQCHHPEHSLDFRSRETLRPHSYIPCELICWNIKTSTVKK
jgi:hypothetical protein